MIQNADQVPLWSPLVTLPPYDEIPDLDAVTHRIIERGKKNEFHYLHTTTLAFHREHLYVGWASHPTMEINLREECVRGSRSTDDGVTWESAATWVAPTVNGSEGFNHSVIASCFDRLWGFFTRWNGGKPSTEIFLLQEGSGCWESTGTIIPGFITFGPPRRLPDGNYIMSGEIFWYEGAVAISEGEDFTRWKIVQMPRPDGIKLLFAEPTLMEHDGKLTAIFRPQSNGPAPVSFSEDAGQSWTPLALSNFPIDNSKPWCGRLSSGQHYLLFNEVTERRTLLGIAVTRPGGAVFERIWKLRHQAFPKTRLYCDFGSGSFVGRPTQWSYPSALEHENNLYISYNQSKEDAWLSIIPIAALGVEPAVS